MSQTRKSALEKLRDKSIYKIEKSKEDKEKIEERKRDGKTPKVIGYCRVSTTTQGDEGDSLDNQEKQIRDYCKSKGLDCVNILREVASGSLHFQQRPLLKHIMRELDEKRIDGFVIYKLDRLSRSIRDTIEILSTCSDKGWLFYEIKHNLTTDGPIAKFQCFLFSALAELERSQIIERTNEVIAYKRSKSHLLGAVPFGKNVVVKDGVKVLVENKDEMRALTRIMELVDEKYKDHKGKLKNHSLAEIARIMEREGFKNKVGNVNWYPTTIKRYIEQSRWKAPESKAVQTEKLEDIKESEETVGDKSRDDKDEDEDEKEPQKPPVLIRQKGYYKLDEEDEKDLEESI